MFEIDHAVWLRLSPMLDVAIELPPDQRKACLGEACAEGPDLRDLAAMWLEGAGRPSILLDRPVTIPLRLWRGFSVEDAGRDDVRGLVSAASASSPDPAAGR